MRVTGERASMLRKILIGGAILALLFMNLPSVAAQSAEAGGKAKLAYKDYGVIGAGVGVAVVDTGVVNHPDLQRPKNWPQVVEVEIVGHETGLADYYGHGTHVAGIINGSGASSSDRYAYRTYR